MDLKSLFKRKAAADKPTVPKAADKPKKPEKARKVRTLSKRSQWGALLTVLLLLCGGAAFYVLYWPDFAKEYADILPSFMTEEEMKAPPPAPVPKPRPPKVVAASSVAPTSGIVNASAVSPMSAVSGVGSQGAAASSIIAGNTSAVASGVSASSAVTTATPLDAIPADVSAPTPTPKPRLAATRPKNRDMRHCLDLKTEAEIMRCVYPKH